MSREIKLFAGNANPALSERIANTLHLSLGKISVGRFSDGEITVEILENVRGREVFIIQPMCNPVNDNLMELMFMADAFKRASATKSPQFALTLAMRDKIYEFALPVCQFRLK